MSQMPTPLFTIGHSNHPPGRFVELLQQHSVESVADVRSSPYNRSPYTAHFNRNTLEGLLEEHGIRYVFMGAELGGRPADQSCYDAAGRVQYDRLARTDDFLFGIRDLLRHASEYRVALLCSEKEPAECHRTLLVAHTLTTEYGVASSDVQHVLADGRLRSHSDVMERLVDSANARKAQVRQYDMFAAPGGSDEMAQVIERAVREQAARVAYVSSRPTSADNDRDDMP